VMNPALAKGKPDMIQITTGQSMQGNFQDVNMPCFHSSSIAQLSWRVPYRGWGLGDVRQYMRGTKSRNEKSIMLILHGVVRIHFKVMLHCN